MPDDKPMDITKPGISPASSTSKPPLVSIQEVTKDPMVVAQDRDTKTAKDTNFGNKSVSLKPTMSKEALEKATADDTQDKASDLDDNELPQGVIESKQQVVDEESEKVQKLIDSKTYYLPIRTGRSRLLILWIVVGIVLVAVIVGAVIAIK